MTRCNTCARACSGKLITIQVDSYQAVICLDRLLDLPLVRIRKLISLICSDDQTNATAIEQLTSYLTPLASDAATPKRWALRAKSALAHLSAASQ